MQLNKFCVGYYICLNIYLCTRKIYTSTQIIFFLMEISALKQQLTILEVADRLDIRVDFTKPKPGTIDTHTKRDRGWL
jgi:hypothetical protein